MATLDEENSNWAFISRDDRHIMKVSKAGHLHGLGDIKPGLHLEVLPYATGGYGNVGSRSAEGWSRDFGLDLKYSIASNLTLDTTFNPDFAHIEADENQINLTRFELFLKEKRPFFLEGQRLFTAMDIFYSRRISEPDAGTKITGKIGKNSIGMIAARNRPADEEADKVQRRLLQCWNSAHSFQYFRLQSLTQAIFLQLQIVTHL